MESLNTKWQRLDLPIIWMLVFFANSGALSYGENGWQELIFSAGEDP